VYRSTGQMSPLAMASDRRLMSAQSAALARLNIVNDVKQFSSKKDVSGRRGKFRDH